MRVGSWLASIALLGSLAACAPPPKPPTFPTFTADQLPPNPVFVSLPASQAAANLAAALKCGTDSRGGTVHLDTAAVDGTSTILTGLGSGDEAGLSLLVSPAPVGAKILSTKGMSFPLSRKLVRYAERGCAGIVAE